VPLAVQLPAEHSGLRPFGEHGQPEGIHPGVAQGMHDACACAVGAAIETMTGNAKAAKPTFLTNWRLLIPLNCDGFTTVF
jgi:hypothetical protein